LGFQRSIYYHEDDRKTSQFIINKTPLRKFNKIYKKIWNKKKKHKKYYIDLIKKNTLYKGPDNLFRIALNKKLISISIRKRPKVKKNFSLLLFKYKRVEPNYKNLYYKKILAKLSKVDSSKFDVALVSNNRILETGTSNLVFIKNGKIFSPKRNCYFGNTLKFISKKIKINFKDILIKEIKDYEEIILIGSGKGVTPVSKIDELKWKSRNNISFNKLSKIYNTLI